MAIPEVRCRGITLRFETADLLSRSEGALAIACKPDFDLNVGLLQYVARAGGQQFADAVMHLRNAHNRIDAPIAVSVPASGSLQCQHVILVPLRRHFNQLMNEVFTEIIQCAAQLGVQSLAMPPIGTGGFHMAREDVRDAMQAALSVTYSFGTLQTITIVDRTPASVNYFYIAMQLFVLDDEAQNPNLYGAQNTNAAGPSTSQDIAAKVPFATFFDPLTLEQLTEAREKRIKEVKESGLDKRDDEEALDGCPVCLLDMLDLDNYDANGDMTVVQLNRCPHMFHRRCLVAWFTAKPQCPICNTWYMPARGTQPRNGTMQHVICRGRLDGFPERTHIKITYHFPDGVQGPEHPRPDLPYKGTTRVCYLPNNDEGQAVLDLLELAFDRQLVFTVGDSVTTGRQNVVTWNGIHHKTNKRGGPQNYGYPDPGYLQRVKQELALVGITESVLARQNAFDNDEDMEESESSEDESSDED